MRLAVIYILFLKNEFFIKCLVGFWKRKHMHQKNSKSSEFFLTAWSRMATGANASAGVETRSKSAKRCAPSTPRLC